MSDPLDGPTEEGAAPVAPFSASAETAWALWVHHGLFTIPLRIDRWADDAGIERKKLQPLVRYASPDDLALDDDTLERIWLEHADAPGIGLLLARQGLVALDTDTPDADEWVRARKLDRTPTIRSRRGSKWILRGTAEQSASVLHPDVDVAISLVPLPPTPGYEWLPSLGFDDVGPTPVPAWVTPNGQRRRRSKVTVVDGPELPAGQAHAEMLRILGKLAPALSVEELWTTAVSLNKGRLPDPELREQVAYLAAKEGTLPPLAMAPPTSEGSSSLADVRAAFRRWLLLPDLSAVDLALAAVAAHRGSGEPLWPLLVSPPSGGKTEVIRALTGVTEVYPLGSLTAQTFVSGIAGKRNASLLRRLDDMGKSFLTFKDFTTVLTLHGDARAEILAQLREIYDGNFSKDFGTGESVAWEGRIGFLAGVTPAIDTHHGATAIMGERFSYLRMAEPSRRDLLGTVLEGRDQEAQMRAELRETVAAFFASLQAPPEHAPLDANTKTWLAGLADLVTFMRSAVQRDGYSREVLIVPSPEGPARFAKQIASLYRALGVIGCTTEETHMLVERVAEGSIPPERLAVLRLLTDRDPETPTQVIADAVSLPTTTTKRIVEDLAALRLVCRTAGTGGVGGGHRWTITEEGARLWTTSGIE